MRPADSYDWAGRVIAVYEAYDGVLYAVQRAFGKVCSYKAELEANLQCQKDLNIEIERLARRRITLQTQETDIRHSLREVFTEPLDFNS